VALICFLTPQEHAVAVTIKQIAERAGLSIPTVSRILNSDSQLFRPETRERVHKAARDLGYRPNSYRMALRTKRFNAIGLLCNAQRVRDHVFPDSIRALLGELHRRNQHLVAGDVPDEALKDDASLPKLLREWSVDGMFVAYVAAAPRKMIELIDRNRIPTIWFNARREADCVYPDDFVGAREGTARLLRLGHQRIAFMDLTDDGHYSHADRRAGYEVAMTDAERAPILLVPPLVAPSARGTLIGQWLRDLSRSRAAPTAVLCYEADVAVPLYVAALQAGLRVPQDLSILTFHDEAVDIAGPRISVMSLPATEMAIAGLEALDQKIADPARPLPPRPLALKYQEGMTVAGPRN
jgi:LacI family transcriptional regulator